MAFDRTLIDQYENGSQHLALAVRSLTREDMFCPTPPGQWSIQQVVIHLMDSDLIGADRMKRIIAEEGPTLIGYNQTRFASHLHYDEQSADDAITILDLNRKNFAKVLRNLPDSAYSRSGTHNEHGKLTLGQMLKNYVDHLEHHVKFIHDKRARMGKEMW